ncbi:MAG TPA: Cfr10I/Bse634I family restriction endonuclease [Candidatus Binatia bacterium]|nr:Cfr10I/Bse634I family restriction endonuclease [Candidatus Binatia bacterium]
MANLTESKSQRSTASGLPQTESEYAIDARCFIDSRFACVEPDPRNPGRSSIRAENCLFAAFGRELPPVGVPIIKILGEMQAALLAACSELKLGFPDEDSLQWAWDQWYEFMVAVALWNANANSLNRRPACWLRLPGTSKLYFAQLLEPKARERIAALERRLREQGAILALPNPNLICLRAGPDHQLPAAVYKSIDAYSREAYETVMQSYHSVLGACDYREIRTCVGLKTFSRLDRHPWIPHEADILKSAFAYLHQQAEDRIPSTRYFAITSFEPSKSDEYAYAAVACRSVLDETIPAERAVDGLLYLQNLSEIADQLPSIVA